MAGPMGWGARTARTASAAHAATRRPAARALFERIGLASTAAPARSGLSLSGLDIVNPGIGRIADSSIQLRGDRIAAIGAADPDADAEFSGCTAIPGLIDMHVHAPPPLRDLFGRLQLLHGVTSVRNTGDGLDVFDYREEIEAGSRVGPRVFACGPPLDGNPKAFPFGTAGLDRPERARDFVAELARRDLRAAGSREARTTHQEAARCRPRRTI